MTSVLRQYLRIGDAEIVLTSPIRLQQFVVSQSLTLRDAVETRVRAMQMLVINARIVSGTTTAAVEECEQAK